MRFSFIGVLVLSVLVTAFTNCSNGGMESSKVSASAYSIEMSMARLTSANPNPFRVTVSLSQSGVPLSGKTLTLIVPRGTVGPVTDNSDGTYSFTVTPATTGTYPVTVSYGGVSLKRSAIVLDTVLSGAGQPMAVPGDYVNTEGYEDGATITPDGQYLFVHYGPLYFTGVAMFPSICSSGSYSAGYDLNTCSSRPNGSLVFSTIGPYSAPYRPGFPTGGIDTGGILHHVPSLVIPGNINGLAAFPTVFYGFKRQSDGTFAEPFKVAFNDARGISGPFGLSFKSNGDGTADFIVAWDNYFDNLGSAGAHVYTGTLTLGQNFNMGDVAYSGEFYSSITPHITPVISAPVGVQGNPHLYYDSGGNVKSIWTDDETTTNDLTVYRLTAGTLSSGTWAKDTLPSVINTAAAESQPFFTGDKLILNRDTRIVYHAYTPTNGSCANGFTSNNCWGPEVPILESNGHTTAGEIYGVGEPTIAAMNGKKYLYFVYIDTRANAGVSLPDFNGEVGFVELP